MELVWAATLWSLWSCWLVCQFVHAPAVYTRSAVALLLAELVALAVHSYGCGPASCGLGARVAGSIATIDVPGLAVLLFASAALHAWRRAADR